MNNDDGKPCNPNANFVKSCSSRNSRNALENVSFAVQQETNNNEYPPDGYRYKKRRYDEEEYIEDSPSRFEERPFKYLKHYHHKAWEFKSSVRYDSDGMTITTIRKIQIPQKEYPTYNFIGRIIGPRGKTLQQLQQQSGCRIRIRGKGSESREGIDAHHPLHIFVEAHGKDEVSVTAKLDICFALLDPFLVPVLDGSKDSIVQNQMKLLVELKGAESDTGSSSSTTTSNEFNASNILTILNTALSKQEKVENDNIQYKQMNTISPENVHKIEQNVSSDNHNELTQEILQMKQEIQSSERELQEDIQQGINEHIQDHTDSTNHDQKEVQISSTLEKKVLGEWIIAGIEMLPNVITKYLDAIKKPIKTNVSLIQYLITTPLTIQDLELLSNLLA